jgi:hypothetical protein
MMSGRLFCSVCGKSIFTSIRKQGGGSVRKYAQLMVCGLLMIVRRG